MRAVGPGRTIRAMKIAAVQMISGPDWPANRDAAARLVGEAAAAGASRSSRAAASSRR